ncbi:MAG: hypothetical protein Q9160_008150 [Pyrenula sp. 1 TL-2023]
MEPLPPPPGRKPPLSPTDILKIAPPESQKTVPLTCHGHSRPVTHLSYSSILEGETYYLLSACKDNYPMLRDGITGDWIGTFVGHKGAVWSSEIAVDGKTAATGSADFTAKIWDTQTGECLYTLAHNHIVRAVSFPRQKAPPVVITGGADKVLRIWDLERCTKNPEATGTRNQASNGTSTTAPEPTNQSQAPETSSSIAFEVGPDIHTSTIKSVIWHPNYNIVTTAAEDKTIRWFDLRATTTPIHTYQTSSPISSVNLNTLSILPASDPGLLSCAAGRNVIVFEGSKPGNPPIKTFEFEDHEVASVAVNAESGKLVTGGKSDPWARVWDFKSGEVEEVQKGHHGPIWSTCFSPDGRIYATGSEDGTVKLWKAGEGAWGLWK